MGTAPDSSWVCPHTSLKIIVSFEIGLNRQGCIWKADRVTACRGQEDVCGISRAWKHGI